MTTEQPHGMGWIPDKPDERDYKLADHRPDLLTAVALPVSVDLRPALLPIEDQGQLGSCTAFGSLACFEYAQKKNNLTQFKGSKLAQYYWTRLLEGTSQYDVGASVRDTMRALSIYGMAHDGLDPYFVGNYAVPPSATVQADAANNKALRYIAVPNDTTQIQTILANGYPVVIGFSVYQNFPMGSGMSVIPMPQGGIIGGHCVALVGYDDARQAFLFRNSWGTGWGLQGYCWMPYAYLPANARDFWMLDQVAGVPVPGPTPVPPVPPVPTNFVEVKTPAGGHFSPPIYVAG